VLLVGNAIVQGDFTLHCKMTLELDSSHCYVVHRSNAVIDRAVCFLGRFLPKLGGAFGCRLFLSGPIWRWPNIMQGDQDRPTKVTMSIH
jgi:hypothetical protein